MFKVQFDWECCHLYHFEINGMFIDEESPKKIALTLNALDLKERSKLNYTYDFGDNWEHNITVEKILPYDDFITYPRCIKGKRAAPLEDSGGIWGYQNMLEVLEDEEHPDYADTLEWVGEDYDPEQFDVEEVNDKLSEDIKAFLV